MVIDPKMQKKINEQINAEFYSAYLYLSMAAYFEGETLKGMASWMKKQAQEEKSHGMKFFDYVYARGGHVELEEIKKPQISWKNPLHVFEEAYKHEQHVTKLINEIVDLGSTLNDRATKSFLAWFIDEQVEEEDNARSIVELLSKVGDSKGALYQIDHQLGKRE